MTTLKLINKPHKIGIIYIFFIVLLGILKLLKYKLYIP